MRINFKKFLKSANITEELYPGKRIVKTCQHAGEYKNHCVVVDWRSPDTININVRPGVTGKNLPPELLKKYPVCLQMPTSVKIKVVNDDTNEDEEDEEEGKSKGKSGGGGKKPAKKKLEDIELIAARFGDMAEGQVPTLGEVKEMVVMGIQIAAEAFENAFSELTRQISHTKITATEILAKAADMVTKVQPPSFMEAKGDETANYSYDRDKNADIGMRMTLG
ncbi:MAG: hypothetical protein ACRBCK_07150 [Alphaproteobacteria bacterium]